MGSLVGLFPKAILGAIAGLEEIFGKILEEEGETRVSEHQFGELIQHEGKKIFERERVSMDGEKVIRYQTLLCDSIICA